MNYIYDILTNFNEVYYDFYEWEKKDIITHIKKIPIIKIDKEAFEQIVSHKFKIDSKLIKKIESKTEIWNNKKNLCEKYFLLITNGIDIMGFQFNDLGICIKRSSLMADEELETIETAKKLDTQAINYQLLSKLDKSFTTRNESKNKNFLINELNKLSISKDINKINYLYFECFNKKENNLKKALNTIIHNIENKNILNILNDFFNLIKTSNK